MQGTLRMQINDKFPNLFAFQAYHNTIQMEILKLNI